MINRNLIKKMRNEKGISQDELAKAVGYSDKSMICRIEKGNRNDLPLSKAILLADVLGIDVRDLVKGG